MTPVSNSRVATGSLLALLVAAVVLAYANTFRVPLLFDDVGAIAQNATIEHFGTVFRPPPGLSVSGRPLANLSLAADFAVGGRAVWIYHVTNLALHALNTVLLFGIIRTGCRAYAGSRSVAIPFATALLWAVHPIQTAAVTYIMQRTELLAATCLLLALYAFGRATSAERRSRGWYGLSVAACWLGMAAKEVMVVAPIAVLLYDSAFRTGAVGRSFRQRPRYYAALFASWIFLAALLLEHGRAGSAGIGVGVSVTDYLGTQAYAVLRYIRLALWPVGLVFDYGAPVVHDPDVIACGALVVLMAFAAAILLARRKSAMAFALAWPLLLLAPSSSVVPIATQTIAEHRVYLALAAPLALAVAIAARLAGRLFFPGTVVAALALGGLTYLRNTDYRTERSIWHDTVTKNPQNGRAWYNLGLAEIDAGDHSAALESLIRAVAFDRPNPGAEAHLGELLAESGRVREALLHLEIAVAQRPSAINHANLGNAFLALKQPRDGLAQYEAAAKFDPQSANIQLGRGNALIQLGQPSEAEAAFGEAVRLAPDSAAAHYNHGAALAQLGRYSEALAEFDAAAKLDPNDPAARANAARIRDYLRQ